MDELLAASAIFALTAWLYVLIERASEATLFRATLAVTAVLVAVCVYATLAVTGVVPPAPWSPIGKNPIDPAPVVGSTDTRGV